jgi:hypothetical protein
MIDRERLRQTLGCWAHERWRTELALRLGPSAPPRLSWLGLHNRREDVGVEPGGVACRWQGSSPLTVARVFPAVGARLLRHCLRQWPIVFRDRFEPSPDPPVVSVVLPVGGADRIHLFQSVIRAFCGQSLKALELIVVEHAAVPVYERHCPPGVRYVHVADRPGHEFNRSRTLNAGAAVARGRFLVLHDADALPPFHLCEEVAKRMRDEHDGWLPHRLIFYLTPEGSSTFAGSDGAELPSDVDEVVQNNPSTCDAVLRSAFESIGGYDERYQGWGGEDEEFLERLRTRRFLRGGILPLVHLWHPPAPKKASGDRNLRLSAEVMAQPVEQRIRRLQALAGPPPGERVQP